MWDSSKNDQWANLIYTVTSPDKDAKRQAVFSELQPPTEYFPSLSVNFLLPDSKAPLKGYERETQNRSSR